MARSSLDRLCVFECAVIFGKNVPRIPGKWIPRWENESQDGKMNPKMRAFMGFPTKNRTASLMLKSELHPPWNKQFAPEKFNGWKIHFLSGSPMFGAYVSFREGRWFLIICIFFCPQVTSCLLGLFFYPLIPRVGRKWTHWTHFKVEEGFSDDEVRLFSTRSFPSLKLLFHYIFETPTSKDFFSLLGPREVVESKSHFGGFSGCFTSLAKNWRSTHWLYGWVWLLPASFDRERWRLPRLPSRSLKDWNNWNMIIHAPGRSREIRKPHHSFVALTLG